MAPHEKLGQYLSNIAEGGSRLLNLLDCLQGLAPLATGKMAYGMDETALLRAMREVVRVCGTLSTEERVTVENLPAGEEPIVDGNPVRQSSPSIAAASGRKTTPMEAQRSTFCFREI